MEEQATDKMANKTTTTTTTTSNSTTSKCPVCFDPYTSSVRKEIKCQYCPFSACVSCIKSYMLNTPEDVHCMQCKRAWNRDFVDANLTMAFRKGALKKHREDILLDREKARLPLLQPRIEAKVQAKDLNKQIAEENKLIRELELQTAQIRERVLRLYRRQSRLEDVAAGRIQPDAAEDTNTTTREARQFTQKCPVEDCRGFLSTAWKCSSCQNYTCSECLVPKGKERDGEHTCNEDQKATAALIRKETKPCPKCGMGISKIDGCDQMWCISCQTPFSWTTGRQVFGVVHNPHYYQWLRTQNGGEAPRVAGDIPCGGLVGFYTLQRCCPSTYRREVEAIHRLTAEIHDEHMGGFPRLDEVPDNGDLGIEYTMKNIDLDKWKSELWKRETKRERGLDIRGPLDLFTNVSSEVLRRMCTTTTNKEFEELIQQLRELRTYVNEEMEKIGIRYGSMTPKITNCWRYDAHGSNRGEAIDSRVHAERILVLNPERVAKIEEPVQREIQRQIISYAMPLTDTKEGYKRYAFESTMYNGFGSRYRASLNYLLSEDSPGYSKNPPPKTNEAAAKVNIMTAENLNV